MLDPLQTSRRPSTDDFHTSAAPASPTSRGLDLRVSTDANHALERLDAHLLHGASVLRHERHDASVVEFARLAPAAPLPRSVAKHNEVLYVGLNSVGGQNHAEATSLAAATRGKVKTVVPSKSHVVEALGRSFDFGHAGAVKTFAESMGLPKKQADLVHQALLNVDSPAARSELARIALAWLPAERGEAIPSRLVLSGHSDGRRIYDAAHPENAVSYVSILFLAKAMPAAAKQIEHVMFSASHSSKQLDLFTTWFPNMKTAWSYGTSAHLDPHAPTGRQAVAHVLLWEKQTSGL